MNALQPSASDSGTSLLELSACDVKARLEDFLRRERQPAYRRSQILGWLYVNTPGSFGEMTDLPRALREALQQAFRLHPLEKKLEAISTDGTRKFLWRRVTDGPGSPRGTSGTEIESVLIPDEDRITYCISTQAGCPVKCTFCATGYGGFQGQLSGAEIVDQVLLMRSLTGVRPTNLVYMGMGEPLLNFDAVLRSLEVLTHDEQVGIGARRITVSTVGIPDRIRQLGAAFPQVNLALSLHAPTDELRRELIPLARRYPLDAVLRAVRDHSTSTRRKATFEYVVLPGVNDSRAQARKICHVLRGIPSRINLIGFNPFAEAPYRKPSVRRLIQFRAWLEAEFPGAVTIRRSRGEDIQGACGQLSLRRTADQGAST